MALKKALPPLVERLRWALCEDCGPAGDVTSQALVPFSARADGVVLAKSRGVLCGVEVLAEVFRLAGALLRERGSRRTVRVAILKEDGARVRPGDVVAKVSGPARALLLGERTALNLLSRLSGIATETARYAAAVSGTRAQVLDTRKTTALWRDLEKYAVRCGGGENHRVGLHDMILIKDNHLALWGARDPAGAVRAAQARFPRLPVEVEVTDLRGLKQVCGHSRPDFVLLDNFTPARARRAVAWCAAFHHRGARPRLEASGGLTLKNARAFAAAGVDRLSAGALTHSARAQDFSFELTPRRASR